jgi:hypothetical protein
MEKLAVPSIACMAAVMMQGFQNTPAYFAAAVSHTQKMFMKLTPEKGNSSQNGC